jgi:hypothetical protein
MAAAVSRPFFIAPFNWPTVASSHSKERRWENRAKIEPAVADIANIAALPATPVLRKSRRFTRATLAQTGGDGNRIGTGSVTALGRKFPGLEGASAFNGP